MILAMCGLLGLSIYLTGIVLGMICMMIGQGGYCRYTEKGKRDTWWLLKISLLSWMTVFLAMLLFSEAWYRRNERDMDNQGNHIKK